MKYGKLNLPADHTFAGINGAPVVLQAEWPDRYLVQLLKAQNGYDTDSPLHVPKDGVVWDAE